MNNKLLPANKNGNCQVYSRLESPNNAFAHELRPSWLKVRLQVSLVLTSQYHAILPQNSDNLDKLFKHAYASTYQTTAEIR
jgi:hypothetical protein